MIIWKKLKNQGDAVDGRLKLVWTLFINMEKSIKKDRLICVALKNEHFCHCKLPKFTYGLKTWAVTQLSGHYHEQYSYMNFQ